MAVEAVLSLPWLREAFGGLRFQSPLTLRRRTEVGRTSPTVVAAVVLVALIVSVGVWTSTRSGSEDTPGPGGPSTGASATGDAGFYQVIVVSDPP